MLSRPSTSNAKQVKRKQRIRHDDRFSTRKSVEKCFDKAALNYDANADVQKKAVSLLHQQVMLSEVQGTNATRVQSAQISLDIGCGTGAIYRQLQSDIAYKSGAQSAQWLHLDISHAMLAKARNLNDATWSSPHLANRPVSHFTQGDAYHLPVQSNVIQHVYSSMALQWCNNAALVLAEISRILSTGGAAHLAIMIAPSFSHISECWQRAGYAPRVNTFLNAEDWITSLPASLELVSSNEQCITSQHKNLRELLVSIKSVGANATTTSSSVPSTTTTAATASIAATTVDKVDNASQIKCLTRGELHDVEKECSASNEGFMLDYHLLFLHLRKR